MIMIPSRVSKNLYFLIIASNRNFFIFEGPFKYGAEIPSEIRFQPLGQTKEYTAEELMILYSVTSLHI